MDQDTISRSSHWPATVIRGQWEQKMTVPADTQINKALVGQQGLTLEYCIQPEDSLLPTPCHNWRGQDSKSPTRHACFLEGSLGGTVQGIVYG